MLQLNDAQIGSKVWQILSLVPRNRQIYAAVESCLHEDPSQAMDEEVWAGLLDEGNTHRLLYNLQILKELIECDELEDQQQLDESKHRREGRERFVLNGGLRQTVAFLAKPLQEPLPAEQDGPESEFALHQLKVVSLAMEVYLMYWKAYALSRCDSKQTKADLKRLFALRDTLKELRNEQQSPPYFGVYRSSSQRVSSPSNSLSSAVTPNFQSVGTTPQNIPTPPKDADDSYVSLGKGSQHATNKPEGGSGISFKVNEFN